MSFYSQVAIFLLWEISTHVIVCNNYMAFLNVSFQPPLQNEFPTKCFDGLGCFETAQPFYHPLLRPVSLLPFDEKNIPTKFFLFTRRNPKRPELLDHSQSSILASSFNPNCPTKIFIHGFSVRPSESGEYEILKNAILKSGFYNMILVDWSDSNQSPYFQAIANGRVVGAQIARLIQALQEYTGAAPERFHIIGHSLGSAVAGWAGERIQNLGRITGLDPAGMYFYFAPPEVRLDTSDALFVDVITTNGGTKFEEGFATLEPIGHVNFYPNGGSVQPGCYNSTEDLNGFNIVRNLCSHMRAVYLFTASILNERCRFMGTPCENYESYLYGRCDDRRFWWRSLYNSYYSKKSEMGFYVQVPHLVPVGQKFYLETSAAPPFCIEPYKHRYFFKC